MRKGDTRKHKTWVMGLRVSQQARSLWKQELSKSHHRTPEGRSLCRTPTPSDLETLALPLTSHVTSGKSS